MKFTALVIDDEEDARSNIVRFTNKYSQQIKFVGEADSLKSGFLAIEELKPDIIFLDIHLGDGRGFDLLEKDIRIESKVIFVTAYDKFAVKAFKLKASNYILKPINHEEFNDALEIVCKQLELERENKILKSILTQENTKTLGIPTNHSVKLTNLGQIERLEANVNYTEIYLLNEEKIIVPKTLKSFEKVLSDFQFIRIHQSHIVNESCIAEVVLDKNLVVLKSGHQIPFSRRYKSLLVKMYNLTIR
jgi:two-component system LytT family response regulator